MRTSAGPVHQFRKPPPTVQLDNNATIREIRAAGHWGIVLGAAQHHGFLPRYLLDPNSAVREARDHAWYELDAAGVDRDTIARWWRTNTLVVRSGIAAHRKAYGVIEEYGEPDETKPGMIRGHGEKHEDCTRYAGCLSAYAAKSGFQARCPDACSGYVQIKRRATDYLKQRDAPSVCAQATSKGAGI